MTDDGVRIFATTAPLTALPRLVRGKDGRVALDDDGRPRLIRGAIVSEPGAPLKIEPLMPDGTEYVVNGEHVFAFPPDPSRGGASNSLGKCQNPCRMIVTRSEAEHRRFGLCRG